jgi:hypothetical protein
LLTLIASIDDYFRYSSTFPFVDPTLKVCTRLHYLEPAYDALDSRSMLFDVV